MHRRLALILAAGTVVPFASLASGAPAQGGFSFASIDGGVIDLDDLRGRPVLVVNTASLCGFADQFNDLQALQDRYGPRGLYVLAVPSNDFDQELATGDAVKTYCTLTFDVTLSMTDITPVKGPSAHPFYAWLRDTQGFEPAWNFNKVLLDPQGHVAATWGAPVKPTGRRITSAIEELLP
jgi:glutathione peroxidase